MSSRESTEHTQTHLLLPVIILPASSNFCKLLRRTFWLAISAFVPPPLALVSVNLTRSIPEFLLLTSGWFMPGIWTDDSVLRPACAESSWKIRRDTGWSIWIVSNVFSNYIATRTRLGNYKLLFNRWSIFTFCNCALVWLQLRNFLVYQVKSNRFSYPNEHLQRIFW